MSRRREMKVCRSADSGEEGEEGRRRSSWMVRLPREVSASRPGSVGRWGAVTLAGEEGGGGGWK